MKQLAPLLVLLLTACGGILPRPVEDRRETPAAVPPAPTISKPAPAKPSWTLKKGGGFYKDDGPGDNPPPDLDAIPDAVPKAEPLHRFANNPYTVLGQTYVPAREIKPYKKQGIGSWYGRKFHGQKTSSGESYDMYGMTAAHPTLPIPSFVRVTNPANGKTVIVRVNDRGPFHSARVIDLSYTAAWKLGYIGNGSTLVEVESILPGEQVAAVSPAPTSSREDAIDKLLAAPESQAPQALAQMKDARGHFLQLGAFGNRENADSFLSHLARELGNELGDKLAIQSSGPLHRVQLGPFADAAEARRVGDTLRESFGMKPVAVKR